MFARLTENLQNWGATPTEKPERRQKRRILIAAMSISTLPTCLSVLGMLSMGANWAAAALGGLALGMVGLLAWLRLRPNAYRTVIHLVAAGNVGVSFAVTLLFGGITGSGDNVGWALIGPLVVLIGLDRAAARVWLGIFIATVALCAIVPHWWPGLYVLPDRDAAAAMNMILPYLFMFICLLSMDRKRDELQQKSDDLLRNILPAQIADQLKERGGLIAEHFDACSVLFADLVDFTPLSARLTPVELVALLDEVFSAFDHLVAKYDLEKIKTIGDCYMVASGVPTPRVDHAEALARLALDMQELVTSRTFGGQNLRFRIGLNSGPVVAGVIGQRKFIYDLWGDAVNTASRMESHGKPGLIQTTRTTRDLLGDAFNCQARGVVNVKGKVDMEVFELIA